MSENETLIRDIVKGMKKMEKLQVERELSKDISSTPEATIHKSIQATIAA